MKKTFILVLFIPTQYPPPCLYSSYCDGVLYRSLVHFSRCNIAKRSATVTTGLLTGRDAPALVNSAEAAVGNAAPLLAGRLSAGGFCEEVRRFFWRSSYLRLHFSLKSSCCPPLQPRTASPCPYLSGLLLLPRAWTSTLDLPGPLSRS